MVLRSELTGGIEAKQTPIIYERVRSLSNGDYTGARLRQVSARQIYRKMMYTCLKGESQLANSNEIYMYSKGHQGQTATINLS